MAYAKLDAPEFEPYVDYLGKLVGLGAQLSEVDLAPHLDGAAYTELRRVVPIGARRRSGTFFTSSELRTKLVSPYARSIARGSQVLDPSCGAGDLLLAAAECLPRSLSAAERVRRASQQLMGLEILDVLTRVAHARIALLLAQSKAGFPQSDHERREMFPFVTTADGFQPNVVYNKAKIVLMNPPFARTELSSKEAWGEGLHTAAAPFTLSVLNQCLPGTRIAAILPDVLRSGPRYYKWRKEIESKAFVEEVEPMGLFDRWTDVDVFILRLVKRSRRTSRTTSVTWTSEVPPNAGSSTALGEKAVVCVGDVVPHRDDLTTGPTVPLLDIRSVPVGATVRRATTVRYSGRLHEAPFLVLRRTSAPTRGRSVPRALVSIIHPDLGEVAVENHLIVVKPREGGLAACMDLARKLNSPATTQWLDLHVGTRHLTKAALTNLPIT